MTEEVRITGEDVAGIGEVSNQIKLEKSCLDKVRTVTQWREGPREPEINMKREGWRRAQTETRPVVRAVKGQVEVYGPP